MQVSELEEGPSWLVPMSAVADDEDDDFDEDDDLDDEDDDFDEDSDDDFDDDDQNIAIDFQAHILEQAKGEKRADGG